MKKWIALLLAACMLFALIGCAAKTAPASAKPEEFMFTDSVGRTVVLPDNIEKVAVSGPLAQIVVFALCPDKLVGIAQKWDKTAEKYLETLLASGAQVVIDVGEPKGSIAEDLDALSEQTGIPFVHITATIGTMGDAYRKLGELLHMPDEAEALAAYCDGTYAKIAKLAERVENVDLLYITGDKGLNVIARGSYHAEIIDLLSNNLAVVDNPSSKGTGNEVDMEQIMLWNPDVILFAPGSVYASVGSDPMWSDIAAVKTGAYYEVPFGPYNWMGFPPSVQRILGMLWMAKLLYPEAADYDLYTEVAEYFKLFYHCDLSESDYHELTMHSIGK